jgi:hypothetical protein
MNDQNIKSPNPKSESEPPAKIDALLYPSPVVISDVIGGLPKAFAETIILFSVVLQNNSNSQIPLLAVILDHALIMTGKVVNFGSGGRCSVTCYTFSEDRFFWKYGRRQSREVLSCTILF